MKVEAKTKAELERELGKMRQRLAELEASETERRRAEHADVIFNSSLDMIISVDLNRNITKFNRAAEEAFGYAKEELLGRPVDLLYADQAEGLRTHIDTVKDGQFKGEIRNRRKNGDTFYSYLSAAVMRDDNGRVVGLMGISRDITERRRGEEEAWTARHYLTRLIESSTDAIISTDNEGNVVLFNKGAEAMLGYPREDVLGQRVTVVYESEERAKEVMRQMRQGGGTVAGFETILRAKDGTLIPVLISASILFDSQGQEAGTVGFNKDLRERKRGEEALKKSQERFDLAVSGTTDGLWDWDILTGKEWWSPRFHELLGYAEGDIEATYAMFLELLHPEDKDATLDAVRAHLEDRVRYDIEIRLRTKSGEYRWFRSRGQALWDKTGKPIRMAGSIQDITDRKSAEEALRASSLRLVEAQETERRHIARELHDEIGQALTGLKLNLETKTRLPAGVSGEGLVEATAVVNDIMGKVRELSLSLRPPMLDDFGLLHALLWHFQKYTANTNVQVKTANLTGLTGLDGRRFPSEIETAAYRIVQEALTNIARHANAPEASVSLWTDHTTLYVQIQDHGIGFDPEAVQASRPCSGLSGMRERVVLLKGYLTLESAPGAGTQLTAELPLGVSVDGGKESG